MWMVTMQCLDIAWSVASRSHRRECALLSFHSVCLSVIPQPTAYHDWSITTKFGRQVCTYAWTRVSLFGSPVSYTLGTRGKNMQNFAYFQRVFLPLRTWRIVPYDLSLLVTLVYCVKMAESIEMLFRSDGGVAGSHGLMEPCVRLGVPTWKCDWMITVHWHWGLLLPLLLLKHILAICHI